MGNSKHTSSIPRLNQRILSAGAVGLALAAALTYAGPAIDTPAQSDTDDGLSTPALAVDQQASDSTSEPEPLIVGFLDERLGPIVAELSDDLDEQQKIKRQLRSFYATRDYKLVWSDSGEVVGRAQRVADAIANADKHGLDSAAYAPDLLQAEIDNVESKAFPLPNDLLMLETRMTASLLRFARDLDQGLVDPAAIDGEWFKDAHSEPVLATLHEALAETGPDALRRSLIPQHEDYRQLVAVTGHYREIAAAGGWPMVDDSNTLEPGDVVETALLDQLASRLQAEGDLAGDWQQSAEEARYEDGLVAAVGRFQERHGLTNDGKVGPDTFAALNVSATDRLRQIEANLERWRWMPDTLPANRIDVNVPEFRLRGYRGGEQKITMRVVVGKRDWQTPIFEDKIEYAVTNPYWNVPKSIAHDEVLPELRDDPDHLRKKNMEMVGPDGNTIDPSQVDWSAPGAYYSEYRIRQRPGTANALGSIKFIFPNKHGVYLHDTPSQRAFERDFRAVSHGCVRVHDPEALAEFIFDGEKEETVETALETGDREHVSLVKPLPVKLNYWTAFVDDDGRVNFRQDVYGYDAEVLELLDRKLQTTEDEALASL